MPQGEAPCAGSKLLLENLSTMKLILSLTCLFTLLATNGCIVAEGGHRHARYERHDEVIVTSPVMVVRPPVVVVPVVRVH